MFLVTNKSNLQRLKIKMKMHEKKHDYTIFGYYFSYTSINNLDENFNKNRWWRFNIRSPKIGENKNLFNNYILGLRLTKINDKNRLQYIIRKQILKKN